MLYAPIDSPPDELLFGVIDFYEFVAKDNLERGLASFEKFLKDYKWPKPRKLVLKIPDMNEENPISKRKYREKIMDIHLNNLSKWFNLKALDICGRLDEAVLKRLLSNINCTTLKEYSHSNINLTEPLMELIFTHFLCLEKLDLRLYNLRHDQMEYIARSDLPCLRSLTLDCCGEDPSKVIERYHLQLEVLRIINPAVLHDFRAYEIEICYKLRALTVSQLTTCYATKSLPNLEELRQDYKRETRKSNRIVGYSISFDVLSNLRHVTLIRITWLTDKDLCVLCATNSATLRSLEVKDSTLDGSFLSVNLLACDKLEKLVFCDCLPEWGKRFLRQIFYSPLLPLLRELILDRFQMKKPIST